MKRGRPPVAPFPCPKCAGNCGVIETRPQANHIYRRRWCASCGNRISTYETTASQRGAWLSALLLVAKITDDLEDLRKALGILEGEN